LPAIAVIQNFPVLAVFILIEGVALALLVAIPVEIGAAFDVAAAAIISLIAVGGFGTLVIAALAVAIFFVSIFQMAIALAADWCAAVVAGFAVVVDALPFGGGDFFFVTMFALFAGLAAIVAEFALRDRPAILEALLSATSTAATTTATTPAFPAALAFHRFAGLAIAWRTVLIARALLISRSAVGVVVIADEGPARVTVSAGQSRCTRSGASRRASLVHFRHRLTGIWLAGIRFSLTGIRLARIMFFFALVLVRAIFDRLHIAIEFLTLFLLGSAALLLLRALAGTTALPILSPATLLSAALLRRPAGRTRVQLRLVRHLLQRGQFGQNHHAVAIIE
jgi:hypothetical protein